jgi:hypothetical protein
LRSLWNDYDFFFLHIKKTDSYGEDGNWEGKVKVIEEFDKNLPKILGAKAERSGDHRRPLHALCAQRTLLASCSGAFEVRLCAGRNFPKIYREGVPEGRARHIPS